MGKNIGQNVMEAVVWRDGEAQTLNREQCVFGYRSSAIKTGGGIILKVVLKLAKGDRALIIKEAQDYLLGRQGKFPPYPSAGSFFKNIKLADWPNGREMLPVKYVERGMIPAGWLIEQCALKGYRVGDAAISMEHGNFIVNLGDAASEDILSVVEKAREEVYNRFRIELEPEVEIVKS